MSDIRFLSSLAMKKYLIFLSLLLISTQILVSPRTVLAQVSGWQQGASIVPHSPTDFSSQTFKQSIDDLSASGFSHVTFVIPLYQSNLWSTDIQPGWNTPTDQSLIDAIQYAHNKGLKVNLMFHPETFALDWRAWIDPPDRKSWFANYSNYMNRYGDIAQQYGVSQMTLGVELYKLTSPHVNADNTKYWKELIANLRTHYSGSLTYSAQFANPSEAQQIQFWDNLDYIGISAYFNLNEPLSQSWDQWNNSVIYPLYNQWQKPVIFTEIGYRSVNNSHSDPWNSGRGGYVDLDEQYRNYQALFDYWNNKPYMVGIHLWDWSSNPNAGGSNDTGYTPQGKPAQALISQWFK